jgi:hypothetical protein
LQFNALQSTRKGGDGTRAEALTLKLASSYLELNSHSLQKPVGGLSAELLFGLYIVSLYKGAIVFSEHNREQWEKRKKYKSAYVFSIAKLDSGQRGCSQTSQDVLSKM